MEKKKNRYYDFIFLSSEEYQKLVGKFGEKETNERMENLNNYIGSRGLQRKYKSHYHTILTWARKDEKAKPPVFNQPAGNGYHRVVKPVGKTIGMKEAFTRLKDELDKKKAGSE